MKIVTPEANNSVTRMAFRDFPDLDILAAPDLTKSVKMLSSGKADTMIAGLDYASRDVLLAYKDNLPLKSSYFSSCFICRKGKQLLALADGGVNKLPSREQLYTIVEDTAYTFSAFSGALPNIAMLSYSTNGSGGKNPNLPKIKCVIEKIRKNHPDWIIDGEMQLDAAIDPEISLKKFPDSTVKGEANVLIVPDLNSGNLLYKSLERFGGFTCGGPIIQGFKMPLADLSRGSTVEDVKLTIEVISKLIERS